MSTYQAVIAVNVTETRNGIQTVVEHTSAPILFESGTDDLAENAATALGAFQAPANAPMFAVGHHWVPADADTVDIIPTGNVVGYVVTITPVAEPEAPVG